MNFYLWWIPTLVALLFVPRLVWLYATRRIRSRRTKRMLHDWLRRHGHE